MCPTEIATAKPQPTNDSVQLEPKSAALVAAVFVDFPKNKRKSSRCNKKMQLRPIPRRAAPYEEFLSWGSRHDCPVEVGTYCI